MESTDIVEERPSKRIRLEQPEESALVTETPIATSHQEKSRAAKEEELQLRKELNAGITCYVSADAPGFSGILKQR